MTWRLMKFAGVHKGLGPLMGPAESRRSTLARGPGRRRPAVQCVGKTNCGVE